MESERGRYEVWIAPPHGLVEMGLARLMEDAGCRVSTAVEPRPESDVALVDLCSDSRPWSPPLVELPTLAVACGDDEELAHLLLLGYQGYVSRRDSVATIVKAIAKIAAGEVWAERKVLSRSLELARSERRAEPSPLTERESAVRELVLRGLSNRAIASQLAISEKTVKVHLTHVFRKLGVTNRVRLILDAHDPSGRP